MVVSKSIGYLFILSCIVLGIVCINVLWGIFDTKLTTQFNLNLVMQILFATIGLFFSLIIVGAFFYQIDRDAGRIKKPNRLFERLVGEGEKP
ncbi:MAG: hypothetical protein ACE5I5_15340 [Candidatus Heimdallarchaeota archaeon]